MNEFSGAVLAGIDAGEKAKFQRTEINEILKRLADSIEKATDGVVTIGVVTGLVNSGQDLVRTFSLLFSKEKYRALALKSMQNSSRQKSIEIARWRQDSIGYPCYLTVGNDEYICMNAESLTSILKNIIASPAFGLAISEIVTSHRTSLKSEAAIDQIPLKSVAHNVVLKKTIGKTIDESFAGNKIKLVAAGAPALKGRLTKGGSKPIISEGRPVKKSKSVSKIGAGKILTSPTKTTIAPGKANDRSTRSKVVATKSTGAKSPVAMKSVGKKVATKKSSLKN